MKERRTNIELYTQILTHVQSVNNPTKTSIINNMGAMNGAMNYIVFLKSCGLLTEDYIITEKGFEFYKKAVILLTKLKIIDNKYLGGDHKIDTTANSNIVLGMKLKDEEQITEAKRAIIEELERND